LAGEQEMLSGLIAFLDRLANSTTVENVRDQMVRFFDAHGHPCVVYGYTPAEQGGGYPLPENFYSGVVKQGLRNFAAGAPKHPLVELAGSYPQPFFWGHASSGGKGGDTLRAGNKLLVDCSWARDVRQASCLVVPLHHLNMRQAGLVSIFSELSAHDLERSLEKIGSTLCLAALAGDERLRAIRQLEIANNVGLSPREQECLEWLSKGLRNERIAECMGIAQPTVEMHLAKARRKLGVATREQALVKALILGLICP
jgi:DNA-binding CsgD family transcriptional regulator